MFNFIPYVNEWFYWQKSMAWQQHAKVTPPEISWTVCFRWDFVPAEPRILMMLGKGFNRSHRSLVSRLWLRWRRIMVDFVHISPTGGRGGKSLLKCGVDGGVTGAVFISQLPRSVRNHSFEEKILRCMMVEGGRRRMLLYSLNCFVQEQCGKSGWILRTVPMTPEFKRETLRVDSRVSLDSNAISHCRS